MKAELVEKLIAAHCSGNEQHFVDALNKLVADEEKKGNTPTAARLRKAYLLKDKNDTGTTPTSIHPSETPFFSSSAITAAPRDKESLLELYEIVKSETSFEDVVLADSQKKIIAQLISEQQNAVDLLKHNMAPMNRILLCGPPGCGKTMTAYAIAHELNLPIAYVRLDGLVSSYLGQTSTNLRKVFDSVKNQRIILFLDEFDAIAKKRDDNNELGELKRVVTTLLQNFDNMPPNVLLIAATNHQHLLDPAIWRRFNVTITLDIPTDQQRTNLLEKLISKYNIDSKLDVTLLTKITEGMSGALIEELMVAAAKKYLIEGALKTSDVSAILIQQKTNFSDNATDVMKTICDMLDKGVSLRVVASAMGITHSTLDYQVKKYRGDRDG